MRPQPNSHKCRKQNREFINNTTFNNFTLNNTKSTDKGMRAVYCDMGAKGLNKGPKWVSQIKYFV